MACRLKGKVRSRVKDFSCQVHNGFWTHLASYLMGMEASFIESKGSWIMKTTDLAPVLKLRMCDKAVPLCFLYALTIQC
jgi:hypothetical protein